MKSITQELTDKLIVISRDHNFNTGTHVNQMDIYPFVIVNRADTQFNLTKTTVKGRFFVDVDVWGLNGKDVGNTTDKLMVAYLEPIKLSNGTTAQLDLIASAVRNLDELDPELYRNLLELEFIQN